MACVVKLEDEDIELDRSRYSMVNAVVLTLTDGASYFCRNFETIILASYRWLSENYREGDRIFLFGARSVTCLS